MSCCFSPSPNASKRCSARGRSDETAPSRAAGRSFVKDAEWTRRQERYARREAFILTELVCAQLAPEERFRILDGGAREALSDPRWQALPSARVALHGFEVDAAECEALNAVARARGLGYRYWPLGLWSEPGRRPFYANRSPGGSSLYPQNVALTDRWKFENTKDSFLAREIFRPEGPPCDVELTSLDAWAKEACISDLDFLKLNVQGAELEILRGAESLLPRVTGIMVEVSFVESYAGRPMFSDIDGFLRRQGFSFFDLIGHHAIGRASSPVTAQQCPGLYPQHGQLIEGHGIYFRDPIDASVRGTELFAEESAKVLKLVCFAEMFAQVEFAFELLGWERERAFAAGAVERGDALERLYATALSRYREFLGARP
jgi:FkbM family methyltransferase